MQGVFKLTKEQDELLAKCRAEADPAYQIVFDPVTMSGYVVVTQSRGGIAYIHPRIVKLPIPDTAMFVAQASSALFQMAQYLNVEVQKLAGKLD